MTVYDNLDFDGALFDMDGLVLDTEKVYHKVWKAAGKAYGYDVTEEMVSSLMGGGYDNTKAMFERIFGKDFPFDKVRKLRTEMLEEVFRKEPPEVKPGFKELISCLKETGRKTALATSTERERAMRLLVSAGIPEDTFDETVCGDEVSESKPNPEIFLKAAKKIDVPISKCLVFEDSFNGIRAANAAGAMPIMVPDTVFPTEEIKNLCFRVQKTLWRL